MSDSALTLLEKLQKDILCVKTYFTYPRGLHLEDTTSLWKTPENQAN